MTGNFCRYAMVGLLAMAGFYSVRSDASVVIGGTRLVYPAQDKEVTVKLSNEGKSPSLVQVWMDNGDVESKPDAIKVPFTITPPISRIDAGKSQAVRVMYTKEALPTDKESLFWFNLLDVPPKAENPDGKNLMQFAVRTRIKVFFRPPGLPGDPIAASDKLTWKVVNNEDLKGVALQVTNPTPYYVNFASVGVNIAGQRYVEKRGGMVAPGASNTFQIPDLPAHVANDAKAQFEVINDYGGVGMHEAPISP